MNYVRYQTAAGAAHYGVLEGEKILRVSGSIFDPRHEIGEPEDTAGLQLLAPCEPGKVVGVGRNYYPPKDVLLSGKFQKPSFPLLFLKPSSCVTGPEERIYYPRGETQVNYEGELGIVIGRPCKNAARETAMDYVFGYTAVNDVTAKSAIDRDGQWTRGKCMDGFCPMGPTICSGRAPDDVQVTTRVNGQTVQNGNTAQLIYSIPELIAFISENLTLFPGDVIATGSPYGIGPLCRGDTVEVEVEGAGILKNFVV